jgi:hypothetical protein
MRCEFTVNGQTVLQARKGSVDANGRPICYECGLPREPDLPLCAVCHRRQKLKRGVQPRQEQPPQAEAPRRLGHKSGQKLTHEAKMTAQRLRRALASGRYQRPKTLARNVADLKPKPFICARCGTEFIPQRNTAQYCSPNCRLVAWRARATG